MRFFNQKTVNEIYLSTWANGIEIDSTQFYILESIACQNPLEGGSAVYGARVMIGLDYECSNGENRSMFFDGTTENQTKSENDFHIYPNPSTGSFAFVNSGDELENGTVKVFDITGKFISSFKINSTGDTKIDLSDLSEGMYHYLVTSKNVNVHSGKLIIER